MTSESKRTILAVLAAWRGDSLERAISAFKNCTPAQMQDQYGESGETRQQILDGYRRYAARIDRAADEVRELDSAD